jgi:hypothetical protein
MKTWQDRWKDGLQVDGALHQLLDALRIPYIEYLPRQRQSVFGFNSWTLWTLSDVETPIP